MRGPRGHLKFSAQRLYNFKNKRRTTKLVCTDRVEHQRVAETGLQKALQHKDCWKCTCPGNASQREHIYSNEKCGLYPGQAGQKRWLGGSRGVSEDDCLKIFANTGLRDALMAGLGRRLRGQAMSAPELIWRS